MGYVKGLDEKTSDDAVCVSFFCIMIAVAVFRPYNGDIRTRMGCSMDEDHLDAKRIAHGFSCLNRSVEVDTG